MPIAITIAASILTLLFAGCSTEEDYYAGPSPEPRRIYNISTGQYDLNPDYVSPTRGRNTVQ